MNDIRNFVEMVIGDMDILGRTSVKEGQEGFCTRVYGSRYIIETPAGRKLSWVTKISLRHECGHVMFHELLRENVAYLEKKVAELKSNLLFRWAQYLWYWNPLVRLFRGLVLGYNRSVMYSPHDVYCFSGFRYSDVELFCDWFAVKDLIC